MQRMVSVRSDAYFAAVAVDPLVMVRALARDYRTDQVMPFGPAGLRVRIERLAQRGSVIATQADHEDGQEWLHASISWEDQMPTYADLVALHRAVFGRRRWAYQVFSPEVGHVNLHEYALHLWGRANGNPALPDFGKFGTI